MPRGARIEGAGLIHHATGHSHRTVDAFPDEPSRLGFLSLLADTALRLRWQVLAYCLLSTHYHLLARTDEPNLGEGMRHVHGRHAQRLNARHSSSGPVWRDRFHSKPVRDGRHVVRAAVYVDIIPLLRASVTTHRNGGGARTAQTSDSQRHRAGIESTSLHAHLGASPDEAAEIYRDVVATTLAVERARREASA